MGPVYNLPKPGPFYPFDKSKEVIDLCPGAPRKIRPCYVRPEGLESVVRELFPVK